jgi:S1-C subfamily serine protease
MVGVRVAISSAIGMIAAAVLLAGCGSQGSSENVAEPTVATTPVASTRSAAPRNTLADLVQRVRSGVVRIEVVGCSGGAIEHGVGTGFLIGPRLVATVEHVVDGAGHIVIKQRGKRAATATIIGADPARDLALLRLSKPVGGYQFTVTEVAPRIGDEVAALGFPFGLPFTMTRGSISGLDRTITIDNVDRERLVQTDAAVNPGNSGGPLLRTDTGDVVGLVDLGGGADVHGIAFAVSSRVAEPQLTALLHLEERLENLEVVAEDKPVAPALSRIAEPPERLKRDSHRSGELFLITRGPRADDARMTHRGAER